MQLSICIPTYNRVDYLKEIVGAIAEQIKGCHLFEQVEVVVSNNNSTDGTGDYLSGLGNTYPGITFRINHNKENIGFVKNLLKSVETARAKYWWFIGDDDAIPEDALPKILVELNSHPQTPVFIFNQKGLQKIKHSENITLKKCAEDFYYYMGNAVTICNTQLSLQVIKEYYEDAIATCWPQTYLFFMSMQFSKEALPIRLSTVEAFRFNIQNNINSSSYYLYAQFFSLFKLGYLITDKTKNPAFVNWFPGGIPFINGMKKYSWVFAVNLEYRFFDFESERKEFDTIYKEAKETLLPQHQKYLRLIKAYQSLPDFFFKYYSVTSTALYNFIYALVKKRKLQSPFSIFKQELSKFNTHKEEKDRMRQLKFMHTTSKNDW